MTAGSFYSFNSRKFRRKGNKKIAPNVDLVVQHQRSYYLPLINSPPASTTSGITYHKRDYEIILNT